MSTLPLALPSVRRMSAPLAAAMVAGLCVVSAAVSTSSVAGHHRVSVIHAGAVVHVAPSRKEY